MGEKSFIEVQFPVSKISKESYKERKAGSGQTLTGLGKWWGRKPLILVRATILGLLLPASDNPVKDRDIFLKLLTMDDEGLYKRKVKPIPTKDVYRLLDDEEKNKYFIIDEKGNPKYKKGINNKHKEELQKICFNRLSYDEKITLCCRPEEVDNVLSEEEWLDINNHLKTNANSLQSLIEELGKRKFGHIPIVGDCFAGGGSIPFEAARIGCEVYTSDLNPIACLLNWANLNILSKSDEEIEKLKNFQQKVYDEVDNQIQEWGIETNEEGHRANSYLYCSEADCPECGYTVPLSPSWIIDKKINTIAVLNDNGEKGFYIEIKSGVSNNELKQCENTGTIKKRKMICPNCKSETDMTVIRKDKIDSNGNKIYGIRKWDKDEFINKEDDVIRDRLYCIKYIKKYIDKNGKLKEERYYTSPNEPDIDREKKVIKLLEERFSEYQQKGYIPSMKIEGGYNTDQPIRERGWTYWHQLFNPRQLLIQGLLYESIMNIAKSKEEYTIGLLSINKCTDFNSKLAVWDSGASNVKNTFFNQALNTLFNYGTRGLIKLSNIWKDNINSCNFTTHINTIVAIDARDLNTECDLWVTDPPYADAVNYHELSEFFLAWDKKILEKEFKEWYTDSKKVLAIKGKGKSFNESMIEAYSNLSKNMPDNGMQVVMFTHQDVKVWAELALILWASNLQVTSAWNIATETESGGLKDGGNYVKGTVILVLRKQNSDDTAYLDELYPEIEDEVKNQIDSMRDLDDKDDPNFSDQDYILAAYAAALKILTSYKNIEDIDVQHELLKSDSNSPIVNIINEAKKIAFDYLTPKGFDSYTWRTLLPEERFYIKGLDTEKEGVYKISAYQELGRGFGVREYSDMMASTKANQSRLKTASEFAMKYTNDNSKFGHSVLRNVLIALYKSSKDEDANKGKAWIKNEVEGYWNERSKIVEILNYISTLEYIENMKHWEKDAKSAKILLELVKNDGV
ncbi:DNA methylAse containing a Zn-ribbon [Romboutsia ilealis]|uniref:DNA methylAse containing a Zn-ribbon n=1 Tax=Romboutsia ilealis TaxID=1115758 RepID=A0A1V1I144_9FIRM|nr:anti-phage-associated DUF1156 domain-containing protein [Romboutsia ilealis]CED93849.1 DNA methylAse containing a Zn-ribbon [Romboutsia ilealis]